MTFRVFEFDDTVTPIVSGDNQEDVEAAARELRPDEVLFGQDTDNPGRVWFLRPPHGKATLDKEYVFNKLY